jgi:cysteinyl-tRNA synthetase
MQEMIAQLIANGHAYVGPDGVVYYSVESFPNYGKLSGNTLDRLLTGAGGRISDENQVNKRHPADFMLWKADSSHIMKWDSPWGTGYPGWHIECSCMARKRLGRDVIDIHTGGEDLIFPHHECEIAQTCGATGKDTFARFWMHARFPDGGRRKNVQEQRQLLDRARCPGRPRDGTQVHPAVLRLELIKSHYRANMNFTKKGLLDSAGAVKRLTDFRAKLEAACGGKAEEVSLDYPILKEFAEALADDLNVAGALGAILPWATSTPSDPAAALGALNRINSVLAIAPLDTGVAESAGASGDQAAIDALCKQIDDARKNKDFKAADALRVEIQSKGYDVKTSPNGTVAEKRLA